jgi:adenine-specific DNA-methyltransferase
MQSQAVYDRRKHVAARTRAFVFNQLVPYIGSKRKLLDLIHAGLEGVPRSAEPVFVDLFAGSGVVSRLAKTLGFRVIANDWEPYARVLNTCYIACNTPPLFTQLGGYGAAIAALNALPPRVDWVTQHLCPRDDERYDPRVDRMFYMRKNGTRIDAMRHQIESWRHEGRIDDQEGCCLLAPLLYQACYRSNTSGVFKGFHKGWGGQTATALYRIATDLVLSPAVFCENGRSNVALCQDAQTLAASLARACVDVVYLDPPYNQHPYGSNYHVLNSIALWDKPGCPPQITPGTKSAIRTDWRATRRSAYNSRTEAAGAYVKLLQTIYARRILTSYSTDGTIPLDVLLKANVDRGGVRIEMRGYKRYRVSSQRYSEKPMNVEFVVVTDTQARSTTSVDELRSQIKGAEARVLARHPERTPQQLEPLLFQD